VSGRASCIYEGEVRHQRRTPRQHAFRYRVFLMYIDLDELPRLFDGTALWSVTRPAPARFKRADYHGDAAKPLADAVRDTVYERLGHRPDGPVRMLANLRYLGYCFNPVTFYWCFDPSGTTVTHVVAEVTNTPWGERHAYVSDQLTSRHRKELHVSPFWSMDMDYEWRIGAPGERLEISIGAERHGMRAFDAALHLTRHEITPRQLRAVLLRNPPMTLKFTAAIYAQAARLRLKGIRPYPHPGAAR
jgi:DUF1365 family protein